MKKIIFIACLFIIFLFINLVYSVDKTSTLKVGSKAPKFALFNLNSKMVKLSDYICFDKEKCPINKKYYNVLLSFWSTDCIPCKKEMPELQKLKEKYKDKALKILLISVDKEGSKIIKPYIQKNNINLPVLMDIYKVTAEKYGVKHIPSLFLINMYGQIIYKCVGYKEDNIIRLKSKLKSLFKK